jgi:hypothetical protein
MMVAIDYLEFVLGEKQYKVPALGLAVSEKWRKQFEGKVQGVLDTLKEAGISLGDMGIDDLSTIGDMDVTRLMPVVSVIVREVNGVMDAVGELIVSYGKLEADRDSILETATMKQAIYALVEMVKAEYPFGQIAALFPTGPAVNTTSKS